MEESHLLVSSKLGLWLITREKNQLPLGDAALAIFTYKVPGSRGAFGGMAVLFGLFLVQKFLPKLFDNKIFYGFSIALPVALAAFSLYAGYVYNPEWPYERMALLLLSIALSGRFEIWHNVFWQAPLSLLGGLPTDGDEHHAIDNTFLAVPMNKGCYYSTWLWHWR